MKHCEQYPIAVRHSMWSHRPVSATDWRWSSITIVAAVLHLTACGQSPRTVSDGAPGEAAVCDGELVCSTNLHQILCDGVVAQTCPEGTGCGADHRCVPACQAAVENGSSIGCEYFALAPDVILTGRRACFAAVVVNTWDTAISISVERAGEVLPIGAILRAPIGRGTAIDHAPLDDNLLPPDAVGVLFLAGFGCPAGSGLVEAAIYGTGRGEAFRIATSAPVVVYDIYPYLGGTLAMTSATLLLPTSSWGTDYIGVNAYGKSVQAAEGQPTLALVGAEDGTTVTIRPTANIEGGPGVAPAAAQQVATYALDRGEVLQLSQDVELTGSEIHADKRIGAWGGASCLSIDLADMACDTAHQQLPAVGALGHRYAAVRYRDRFPGIVETVPWRIVGAVDGTELSFRPSPPPGAPATIDRGQLVELWSSGPFSVESQDSAHPFYMSAHMTGSERVSPMPPAPPDYRGDPEFVNVIPLDQYLASYTFYTDPTYPETELVFVREKRDGQFADVTLDCAGTIQDWHPVDGTGDLEYARVDLVTGNFEPIGDCDNGRHVASSTHPFGLVVWGWGTAATDPARTTANSYAYPAGASVRPINDVTIVID